MIDPSFPPAPAGLKGRSSELATLVRTIRATSPARVALVGTGGSGKSMLACALGHRLARDFAGRVHWFRVGSWDVRTLLEMLALRFGLAGAEDRVAALNGFFTRGGKRLVILDNHEDDQAMAELLDSFAGVPVTFIITARRCLLAGVLIFPVVAPLVTSGQSAFPRVGGLTRLLRWSPLALDIADGIVASGAASAAELQRFLVDQGAARVRAVAHEDELPEVMLLVDWAFRRLGAQSRRLLAVLTSVEGDHVDAASLGKLARVQGVEAALDPLRRWRLVQEPVQGRYALHAVVRHALRPRAGVEPARFYEHYVTLLERHPERLELEQTHLFAAMDHAHRTSDLGAMLRVERLLRRLEGVD